MIFNLPDEVLEEMREKNCKFFWRLYDYRVLTEGRYISKEIRYNILRRQNWNCNQCSTKLKYDSNSNFNGKVAHIDHIHPYSKRENYVKGERNINEPDNLQALCPECNLKKGKKEIQ